MKRKRRPEMSAFPGHDDEAANVVDGLNARQAKALEALLQEPTIARAAALGGVSERTLRRWLAEAPFRDAVFRALGFLSSVALRAFEARDLDARLEAVERVLKLRKGDAEDAHKRRKRGW